METAAILIPVLGLWTGRLATWAVGAHFFLLLKFLGRSHESIVLITSSTAIIAGTLIIYMSDADHHTVEVSLWATCFLGLLFYFLWRNQSLITSSKDMDAN